MHTRTPDPGDRPYTTEAERHAHAQRLQAAHDRIAAGYTAPTAPTAVPAFETLPAPAPTPGPAPAPRRDPATSRPGVDRIAAAFDALTPTNQHTA